MDVGERPDCTCFGFKRTRVPCSHILALVQQGYCTWDDFPLSYREHPCFTIDEAILNFQEKERTVRDEPIDDVIISEGGFSSTLLQRLCREKLSLIRETTYLVESQSELEYLYNILGEAASIAESLVEKEEDLPILPRSKSVESANATCTPEKLSKKAAAVSCLCAYFIQIYI